MEREVIFAEDAEKIFGKRPWASRSEEILEPIEESINSAEVAKSAKKTKKSETSKQPILTESTEEPEVTNTPEPTPTEALEQPAMTEALEYTKPAKPKSPRKRKEEGLFGGFDFEQDDTTEE